LTTGGDDTPMGSGTKTRLAQTAIGGLRNEYRGGGNVAKHKPLMRTIRGLRNEFGGVPASPDASRLGGLRSDNIRLWLD
jgi:hypothetical protein